MFKKRLAFLALFLCFSNYLWPIDANTIFCEVEKLVEDQCFVDALSLIEDYRCQFGEDCLFDAMLVYTAEYLDEETLCFLLEENSAAHWSHLFYVLAQKKTNDAIILQRKSELLSRKLLTSDPCDPEHFRLFARSARTFEKVPLVDYIALRRGYGNLLALECNCESLADMAFAAHFATWIDYSSILYKRYFSSCIGNAEQYYDYSKVLKTQYNVTAALRMNEFYGNCVNYNLSYWKNVADILNFGSLGQGAYDILVRLLEIEPDDFLNWALFSQAAATINHRYESIVGLQWAECLKPADIETEWAEWIALPPVMSRFSVYASHYHESTTLANVLEGVNYYAARDLYTRYIMGVEAFQTLARPKILLIGGLGRLTGPNGQENADIETGWVGIEKLIDPKLLTTFNVGVGRMYISHVGEKWTPAYSLTLDSRQSDCLNLRLYSTYNYYQVSPRASAFQIRRWRNELTIDWRPNYDTQFLTILDGRLITDGNKQLEIFFFPRRHFYYLEHWKLTGGLLGNWLTTRKDPFHGYYAPHIYQVYAGQFIAEYRPNIHSTVRGFFSGGTQKDNFSTFFGPYAQVTLDCLFGLSLYWELRLFGDYYYVRQSTGSFNYLKFFGELSYRF